VSAITTKAEEPTNFGGLVGIWLSAIWKAGIEAMFFVLAGVLLGCAFSIAYGDKCVKLGIVDYRLALLCAGLAAVVFFLTLVFRTRSIQRANETWASADEKESAFRKARGEVEEERQALRMERAPVDDWINKKVEDLAIDPGGITVDDVTLTKESKNTLKVSVSVHNNTGSHIKISGLMFSWEKTPKMPSPDWRVSAFFPMHPGECDIIDSKTFTECFELVRALDGGQLPGATMVGLCFTRYGIVIKQWRERVITVFYDNTARQS